MAIRDLRSRTTKTRMQEVMPNSDASETYIDKGCNFSGTLRFKDSVRIDGHVEGDIVCDMAVIVGEDAIIEASIRAESIEVHGTISGDVLVQRKTVLHKTARVSGEIHTAGIVVEEGARLKGTIVIGGDDDDVAPTKPKPASSSANASAVGGAEASSPAS